MERRREIPVVDFVNVLGSPEEVMYTPPPSIRCRHEEA